MQDGMFERIEIEKAPAKPGKVWTPWEYVKLTGSEHAHQAALFMWAEKATHYGFQAANDPRCYTEAEYLRATYFPDPVHALGVMHAIPNGGLRNAATAANLKAEGVKMGVPDVMLPCARGGYFGLYIELKKPKAEGKRAGTISTAQVGFANELRIQGYMVAHAYGWENARDAVQTYLLMRRT